MDPTPAALLALQTGFVTNFYEGYEGTETWADKIAMTVPSATKLELYGWMDRLPVMREWIGSRLVATPVLQNRSLINKHWELTYGLDKDAFADDTHGMFSNILREMGEKCVKQDDYQLQALIESNPTGFDGVSFFSTSHPTDTTGRLNSGTQSNDLASTALNPSNWGLARTTMRSFSGRDGKPFNEYPTLLVVPTALEEAARVIAEAPFFSPQTFGNMSTNVGNVKNIYKGSFQVLVIPELTKPKVWYALSANGMIKPFLRQIRQAAQIVPRTSPTDDNVFWTRDYVWGADSRSAYDVTLWWKALRCGDGL